MIDPFAQELSQASQLADEFVLSLCATSKNPITSAVATAAAASSALLKMREEYGDAVVLDFMTAFIASFDVVMSGAPTDCGVRLAFVRKPNEG